MKSIHFLSREMDGSGGASRTLPRGHESDIPPEITAELARGTPAMAFMSNMPRSERSSLLKLLRNYLEGENTRVLALDDVVGEPVGIRRFCELLVAASPPPSQLRDAAEHLAMIFTSPQAGERGLALVIGNADGLSPEAIAFAERLATASEARSLAVQVLLFGSRALQARLPAAGSFVVRELASPPATPDPATIGTVRRTRTGRRLAAVGCVAVLFFFLAAASGDRERQHVPEAATAAVVVPARAVLPGIASDRDTSPAAISPSEPAGGEQSVTLADRESIPAAEHPAAATPAEPPSDTTEAAKAPVQPERAENTVDAPSPAPATPPLSSPQDAAIQPNAGSDAAPGPTPAPPATATTEQVPDASERLSPTGPATPASPTTDAASTRPTVQPDIVPPTAVDEASSAPSAASPVNPPAATATTEEVPASQQLPQSAPETPPAATAAAASPPLPIQPEPATPSAADGGNMAPPPSEDAAATPAVATTEQGPADAPLAWSTPQASQAVTTDAGSPPSSTVQPDGVAPSATNAAPAAAPPAASAAAFVATAAEPPSAKPSPAATTLLARGDELIAIGDVATARVVYERAAALKSGRGATSAGRTYDPRFLHQIGAVGVVPDPDTAAAWYRKGAAMGDEAASSLLGDLGSKASQ